jgi:predicted transcriptional regulator
MTVNSTFRNALSEIPKDVSLQVGWSFGISDKIDARIKEMGLTQKEFAKLVGKSEPEVTRWLSGTHNFTLKTLAKISAVLGEDLIVV